MVSPRRPRRVFLQGATRAALGVSLATLGCGSDNKDGPAPPSPESDSLSTRARARGMLYGAAVEADRLARDPAFAAAVASECNILVAEASMKWAAQRPTADSYDFSRGDALAAFAREHGQGLRGHTLLWHSALPAWFAPTVDDGNAERFLREHVTAVAGHYAGQIHSWDVVNEAIDTASGRADGLRDTPWLRFLGPRYLDLAFATAAAADPSALLTYNEYGLELTSSAARRQATLALLTGLKDRNVPIHALGIQGHVGGTSWSQFDPVAFADFVDRVAALGLKVFITELDVRDDNLPADLTQRDQRVADIYRAYLDVALNAPRVTAVLTWGLSDKYTWIASRYPRSDGLAVRPLPLDADMQRKPAWQSIASAFERTALRPSSP
jgi:endo-1,4-beta-xylanase